MYLSTIVTICIVVVIYLHVVFQLKTSNDLELYEIQMPTKHKLEEVCNFKQPILFDYTEETVMNCTPSSFKEYNGFDVIIYDSNYKKSFVSLEKAFELFETKLYATYQNEDFLNDTMMKQHLLITDSALRPPLVSTIQYDVLMGSPLYTTRLKYMNHYRNYFLVTSGSITVKLAPPRSKKFLNEIKEYESQEFYSSINPWTDVKKVKFLEVKIQSGKLLFIPAYWWYSIRLEKDACVCMFHYKTIMNVLATMPDISLGMLQRQNTKTKIMPIYSTCMK